MEILIVISFYLFFLSSSLSSSLNPPLCNSHDSSALLLFKNSFYLNHSASIQCDEDYDDPYSLFDNIKLKNSSYPKTASWGNDSNCCLWDGVTCDSMSGHVIGLNLSCSWLQGQLHPNSTLFQLSHLQTLNLAFNDFSGSLISSQFGDLSTLMHLNLSSTSFIGVIPPKIAELSKLLSLDLSWNGFFLDEWLSLRLEPSTWEKLILNMTNLQELALDDANMSSIAPSSLSLLKNLSSSLVSLRLSYTKLQGNITSDIFCLENLRHFDLSDNWNLNGQLPKSNWSSPLSFLNLRYTTFLGEVLPDSIGNLKYLDHLDLSSCNFEGRVPLGFSNLTQLTYLDLDWNKFSGEISFLSNLEHLTHLSLGYNNFDTKGSSSLRLEPSTWEKLIQNTTNLKELALDCVNMSSITLNSFSLLMNLSSSLIKLSLWKTSLQGDITNTILQLKNLKYLVLGGTTNIKVQLPQLNWSSITSLYLAGIPFSGEVPDPIGNLKSLKVLSLGDCQFEGPIPPSFKSLTQLRYLDLSSNKFNGGLSFLSTLMNLTSLNLSNNSFSGQIPSSLSNFEHLYSLDLSINHFSGEILDVFHKLSELQYLKLNHNNFSGKVPSSLSNTSVTFLDLSFNMLQGNLPIPFLGAQFFSVSNNKFSGDISFLFCNASSLEILNLSHNNLSGSIPQCLVGLPNLSILDLQMNDFSGNLPSNFSKSNVLKTLNFNSNQLKGSLPLSLSHCNQLEILDIGHNEIRDTFPSWLDDLPELKVLVLRENMFYGAISRSNTKHPFPNLRIFDISNNHFNGSLPTTYIKEFKGMMKVGNVEVGSQYMGSKNYSTYKDSVNITWKGNVIELERILTISTTIDLSMNNFSGGIPDVFGKLSELQYLKLNHNNFSGKVPSSLSNTSVTFLDLSFNMLRGNLPIPLTGSQFFSVSNNKFSGDISLSFCNTSTLEILNLSHNNLSGPIPQCLVGLPNLSVLDLQMNDFSGTLPSNFLKSNVLKTLNFNSNQLKGWLPLSLSHCNQLEILDVGHNEIRDKFPIWLDDLPKLQVLVLRENMFYGAISSSNTKQTFPNLRIFDISNNYFIGSLPTTYIKEFKGMMKVGNVEAGSQYMGSKSYSAYKDSVKITWKGYVIELERILTIFTSIDLSNNRFDGEIPKAIRELHALIGLNLSHNRITGSIPKSIGKLTSLEWLDLSCNKLIGEIPLAMTNLNFLSSLNLSQNQLEGMIPRGEQFNTFENDSYKGNLGLCGAPLSKTCNKDEGELSTPSKEKFGFGWKPVALGYGCGMVFGIFMGYTVFTVGKPQWLVRTFGGQSKKLSKRMRTRAFTN